jgi:hypothetical protein
MSELDQNNGITFLPAPGAWTTVVKSTEGEQPLYRLYKKEEEPQHTLFTCFQSLYLLYLLSNIELELGAESYQCEATQEVDTLLRHVLALTGPSLK